MDNKFLNEEDDHSFANLWTVLEEINKEKKKAEEENRQPDIIKAICETPRADVKPRFRIESGKWLLKEGEGYCCDHCDNEVDVMTPFCCKCGLEMDCVTLPNYYTYQR